MQFHVRIARHRAQGGVDTACQPIEARSPSEAIEAATRATDAFLLGLPGVGVLIDVVQGRAVWSRRVEMSSPHVPSARAA